MEDIERWIRRQVESGYTPEEVKESLKQSGKDPDLVDEVLGDRKHGNGKKFYLFGGAVAAVLLVAALFYFYLFQGVTVTRSIQSPARPGSTPEIVLDINGSYTSLTIEEEIPEGLGIDSHDGGYVNEEKNVITWELLNESATWDAFQKATDRIAENMTNDDLLLLSMRGHGTDGGFTFHGLGVGYSLIADEIDDMNNTGLKNVMIDSCFGGSGKEYFQDLNNTITMFSSGENETADAALFPGALWRYMRTTDQEITLSDSRYSGGGYEFMNSPDLDDDDEVSLWEAWKTYMGLHVPDYPFTPEEYREDLYDAVDDPEALQTPQLVVGNSAELEDFYLADDLAVNRSDERYDVSHPF